jgi:uncharacterized protein YcnI
MRHFLPRTLAAALVAGVAALCLTAGAWAHAKITPPVSKTGAAELYTLIVPNEEDTATTTTVALTVPDGFGVESVLDAPGWKRDIRETGSGEDAVIHSVTWSGGSVAPGEDAVFQFLGEPSESETYSFAVTQTYSGGKVVSWSGPESSDTPAPRVEATSSLGGGGSDTLAIVAIAVGGVALAVGVLALVAGRRQLA